MAVFVVGLVGVYTMHADGDTQLHAAAGATLICAAIYFAAYLAWRRTARRDP